MDRLQRLADVLRRLDDRPIVEVSGAVSEMADGRISVAGLSSAVRVGDRVVLELEAGPATGIVGHIRNGQAIVLPCERTLAVRLNDRVRAAGSFSLAPDASWAGRVVDALGAPIDGAGLLAAGASHVAIDQRAPAAMTRGATGGGLRTGVTAIDVFTPIVSGQRIGIFAGSGVGKSTLLAMLARSPQADIVVIALIGERGREVRDFIHDSLSASRDRIVAVVATGDDSTTMRRFAPRTAMAIAEYFRDHGRSVLVIMDSLTRFAHAQRDHALAAGEPPVSRGYPPSVFRELAALLERAGPGRAGSGSITLISTVLIDGDDHNDPVADAVRGIVDGHLVLDRRIATSGRLPALDVLASISRLATSAWSTDEARIVRDALRLIARFEETKDLRSLGEYRPGSDPLLDRAVAAVPEIYRLLSQRPSDPIIRDPFAILAGLVQARL